MSVRTGGDSVFGFLVLIALARACAWYVYVYSWLKQGGLCVCAGDNVIYIKKRKGFVHLALQSGAHLVPVYSFGENDSYGQVKTGKVGFWRVGMRKEREGGD
jgi:hypothetical protein